MRNMQKNKKILLLLVLVISLSSLAGCAQLRDRLGLLKGDLVGQNFEISVFDHYANKTLAMQGSKISIEVFKEDGGKLLADDETEYDSSVLEITVNGDQLIQVGNTVIFAEKGLDMVEDYELPSEIEVGPGGGLVPIDRYINDLKNRIGKKKTVAVLSPKGIPIGVYEGDKVFVTVPKDLPKMTRLNIDGKSLYIHRANYIIMDTDIME